MQESLYYKHLNTISDINQHLPTLKYYASKCKHITEFGVRAAISTWAFLEAKPATIRSYDIADIPILTFEAIKVFAKENSIDYRFYKQDVLNSTIDKTELLFIDTLHTYEQLSSELTHHSSKVSKYIILHDTVSYAHTGEDGSEFGLVEAVEDFLYSHPTWKLREQYYYNNGLMILENV